MLVGYFRISCLAYFLALALYFFSSVEAWPIFRNAYCASRINSSALATVFTRPPD